MAEVAERYGTTIQCWPGGASFEYRGDVHGPAEQRELRKGYSHGTEEWRAGSDEEWRKIKIELQAQIYSNHEILCCDSSLVDDLLKLGQTDNGDLASAFAWEEVRNIYTNTENFDADECREYASDNGLDLPVVPTVECGDCDGDGEVENPDGEGMIACSTCEGGQVPDPDADEDEGRHGWLTEAREVCQEHAQDNPAEVYEWWRVSSWLCKALHDIGEVTIDNNYGEWWGRTCTGQGYMMDGVLQRVAAYFVDKKY